MLTGALCLRLYVVCTGKNELVSSSNHGFTEDIQRIRGEIYDINSEPFTDTDYENIAVLKPTMKALSSLSNAVDEETVKSIGERMKNGSAVSLNIGKLQIEPNSDAIMMKKKTRYSPDLSAQHLIGYTDSDGRGVTGIEKSYDSILYTGKIFQVRFSADIYGRIISGGRTEIINSNLKTGSVYLTLDKRIQRITEDALDIGGIKQGGAVVTDVHTGAILAAASRPRFDAENLSNYLDDESAPLVNRVLNAYSVGSVFKAAVAAAALENGVDDFYYTCTGSCNVNGTVFGCNNHKAHGELNMQKALECSCNTYFINLAQKIGGKALLETAKKAGFGQEIGIADGITAAAGTVPDSQSLEKSGNLANFSFGQGSFTATMLQMAQLFSAIANNGMYTEPYAVEKTVSADGTENRHRKKYPVVAMSERTADRLAEMLTSVVENGNAKKAKMKNGIAAAGKTATAQTGMTGKLGGEIYNTWFCGFFPAEAPKYVIIILKQGGSSGAEDCAPIFKSIADKISDLL